MAATTFEVLSYDVELTRETEIEPGVRCCAIVTCHGPAGQQMVLYFVQPGDAVPDNCYDPARGVGSSFLPAEQYLWYVDILRNEKPVFARMHSERPGWNKLFTGAEPVGEGEN